MRRRPKEAETRLVHVVDIRLRPDTKGNRGQRSGEPELLAKDWPATIKTLSGREFDIARQRMATATHRVTIRHFEGLTTRHEFLFRGRVLNIGHVDNLDERDVWHICICEEAK